MQVCSLFPFFMVCMEFRGYVEESHSLRKEAALQNVGTAADTSVSLTRQQWGKQVDRVYISSFGLCGGISPHTIQIPYAPYMGTSEVQFSFT